LTRTGRPSAKIGVIGTSCDLAPPSVRWPAREWDGFRPFDPDQARRQLEQARSIIERAIHLLDVLGPETGGSAANMLAGDGAPLNADVDG
jgi:hypothetical protein